MSSANRFTYTAHIDKFDERVHQELWRIDEKVQYHKELFLTLVTEPDFLHFEELILKKQLELGKYIQCENNFFKNFDHHIHAHVHGILNALKCEFTEEGEDMNIFYYEMYTLLCDYLLIEDTKVYATHHKDISYRTYVSTHLLEDDGGLMTEVFAISPGTSFRRIKETLDSYIQSTYLPFLAYKYKRILEMRAMGKKSVLALERIIDKFGSGWNN